MSDQELAAFLEEQRVVQVSTTGPGGRPHLMPLWYVVEDAPVLRGWTFAKSQKAKNLERDPRATLGIDDGVRYEELRGVMFECDVELERDPEELAALGDSDLQALRRRQRPLRRRARDGAQAGREARGPDVQPTRTVSWDHRKLGGTY